MKKNIFFIYLSFLTTSIFGGEFTGAGGKVMDVLRYHRINQESLKQQGLKVASGEFTGAGRSVHIDRIKMILTNRSKINSGDITHINFKHPSTGKYFGEIKSVEANGKRILNKSMVALIYK